MIKVIIVEDDPMVLEVNKTFLEKVSGFKFTGSAKTGKEALKVVQDKKIDLVLLDIYLPDITGIELLEKIRELDIPIDIITITAARDSSTVQKLFRLGTIDYLVKPFRFERFQKALNNYKKMWGKLHDQELISQEDIDAWIEQGVNKLQKESLPKGLSEITLKQILMALFEQKDPVTAKNLASYLGLARVTVRRYLDYLVQQEKIQVNMAYGQVGRPTHYYFIEQ